MPANDAGRPAPRIDFADPALTFDLPGVEIGVAEYDDGPTGCTVFHFPERVAAAADVRGGAHATTGAYPELDAICLAGGSAYGLEAVSGVAAELFARRGHSVAWPDIALVAGAIIYDYGPRPGSAVYPDRELGRAALRSARPERFPLGRHGAGRSATVGKTFAYEQGEPAGQGAAARTVDDTRVAVFTVVNALGAVVARDGTVVRGHFDRATGARLPLVPELERRLAAGEPTSLAPGHTTLTVIATDQPLVPASLAQLGRQVHASLARAIQPFHTGLDGDVLYAVTTGRGDGRLGATALGVVASELAWDAVLAACAD